MGEILEAIRKHPPKVTDYRAEALESIADAVGAIEKLLSKSMSSKSYAEFAFAKHDLIRLSNRLGELPL